MPQPELIEYIRQFHRQQTRYEIDQRLLWAGYDPAEIDSAWQSFESSFQEIKPRLTFWKVISNSRFRSVFFLYLFGMPFFVNIVGNLFSGTSVGFLFFLILECSILPISLFLRKRDSMVARGLIYSAFMVLLLALGAYAAFELSGLANCGVRGGCP